MVSPVAYDLVLKLVRKNINVLKRVLTKKELIRVDGGSKNKRSKGCSKNEQRRRGLCFICKGLWEPNHSCRGNKNEATRMEQKEIPSNHGDSSIVGSTNFQEITHGESEQLSKDDEKKRDIIQEDL